MTNLFGSEPGKQESFTLADRMRPRTLDDILGQEHLIGSGKPLRKLIERGDFGSMIFWGPPGCGKTTLARVLANESGLPFLSYSAVLSGIKEIREVIKRAKARLAAGGGRSILFIDEIHRFNKAQQDAFLPHVEQGSIIMVGATTENPSFSVISPLLSRMQVYVLNELKPEHIEVIIEKTLSDEERGLGKLGLRAEDGVVRDLAELSGGDARFALTVLEFAANSIDDGVITRELLAELLQSERLHYDRAGEEHFNIISALHKSIRGSDPDAALYWLARMLEAGEDRLYIARRLIRMSIEDIGLADPNALRLAVSAREAFHQLGSPEGELALVELAVYLACAPKSNSIEVAYDRVMADIRAGKNFPVPVHLRNAPTKLMKNLGYGKEYLYAHDFPGHIVEQDYLPEQLKDREYYTPSEQGIEARIKARLEEIKKALGKRK